MHRLKESLSNKSVILLLVSITIVGAILRFYGLGTQSLWNDELSSWRMSDYYTLSSMIREIGPHVGYPPGHFVLLYLLQKYVGDSELILRFPSAVSGVLCILVIFLLGNLVYSRREGILSAALMAILWFPIYYSQEARCYSMLLLFTMIATYFWISIVRGLNEGSKPSSYQIGAYVISSLISLYLHNIALLFVTLQGVGAVMLFFKSRRSLPQIGVTYLLIIIGYLPWINVTMHPVHISVASIQPTSVTFFPKYFASLYNVSERGVLGYFILIGIVMFYSYTLLLTTVEVIKKGAYKDIRGMLLSPDSLVILYLIVPLVVTYGASFVYNVRLTYRYGILSLPAAYLLLSRSITKLPLRARSQAFTGIGITSFFFLHLFFCINYYGEPHKEQFREVVQFVASEDNRYKNSLIIGNSYFDGDYFNYYFRRIGSTRRVDVGGGREEDIAHVAEMISIRNPHYIWFISGHRIPEIKFVEFLNRNFRRIYSKQFSGGVSYQCPGGKPCVQVGLFENELSTSEFLR
jgi:mannosyltransferase